MYLDSWGLRNYFYWYSTGQAKWLCSLWKVCRLSVLEDPTYCLALNTSTVSSVPSITGLSCIAPCTPWEKPGRGCCKYYSCQYNLLSIVCLAGPQTLILHFVSCLEAWSVTQIALWGTQACLWGIMHAVTKHLNDVLGQPEVHVSTGPVFTTVC